MKSTKNLLKMIISIRCIVSYSINYDTLGELLVFALSMSV